MNKKSKKKNKKQIVINKKRPTKKKDVSIYINVLGTVYLLKIPATPDFLDTINCNGFCDDTLKEIQIRDLRDEVGFDKKSAFIDMKHNIRHECLHAFIKECGLSENTSVEISPWVDEGVVDWFALQFEKLQDLFKEAYTILKQLN